MEAAELAAKTRETSRRASRGAWYTGEMRAPLFLPARLSAFNARAAAPMLVCSHARPLSRVETIVSVLSQILEKIKYIKKNLKQVSFLAGFVLFVWGGCTGFLSLFIGLGWLSIMSSNL